MSVSVCLVCAGLAAVQLVIQSMLAYSLLWCTSGFIFSMCTVLLFTVTTAVLVVVVRHVFWSVWFMLYQQLHSQLQLNFTPMLSSIDFATTTCFIHQRITSSYSYMKALHFIRLRLFCTASIWTFFFVCKFNLPIHNSRSPSFAGSVCTMCVQWLALRVYSNNRYAAVCSLLLCVWVPTNRLVRCSL